MSSDKQQKLQRYGRKDYGESVEFPVEIVGRDGLVREYSFEEAVRLYQRRVTFAPIRYRDSELRDAEVLHCSMRIQQLRHSFFVRYGWGTPEGSPDGEALFGLLAGELTAFFQRAFQQQGRAEVLIQSIDDTSDVTCWYVTPRGFKSGMLLYVHHFSGANEEKQREQFFSSLKSLEVDAQTQDVEEHLVAFHHTNDCGFILTDRGDEFRNVAKAQGFEPKVQQEPTQWDILTDMVRRGQYEQSLVMCHERVRGQPWDRKAYMMGAMLSSFLGYELTSEEMGTLGSMYFPEQAELHYWKGLARHRQGRIRNGLSCFEEALRGEPRLVAARYYYALSLVRVGEYGAANQSLLEGLEFKTDDRRGHALIFRLAQWLRWRRWMVAGGIFSQVLGVSIALLGGWVGLIPIAMGVAITWGGVRTFSIQLDRVHDLQRFDDVSYWLRRIGKHEEIRDPMS